MNCCVYKVFCLLLFLLLFSPTGWAQVVGEDASAFESDANYSYSSLPQVRVDNGLQLRVWNVEDGLAESNIFMSYADADFNLYLSHGPVYGISWLDGYRVKKIVTPQRYALHTQGSSDWIWSVWMDSLQSYAKGMLVYDKQKETWTQNPFNEDSPHMKGGMGYVPISSDRALLLYPDNIADLSFVNRQVSSIRSADRSAIGPFVFLKKAKDGGVWILGEKGAAKLTPTQSENPAIWEWKESLFDWPVKQILLYTPIEKRAGELVFTAELDAGYMLIQYDGKELIPLYRSDEPLRFGWREDEESIWFCRGQAGEPLLVNVKNGVEMLHPVSLTGFGYVQVNEENNLFIPKINGLCAYSYYSWRKPDFALNPQYRNLFPGTILQDEKGAIWLSDPEHLNRVEKDRLVSYPKPKGFRDSFYYTQNLLPQPDGRLWIGGNFNEYILSFDSNTGQFEKISHPENRRIGFLFPRRSGGVWAITGDYGRAGIFPFGNIRRKNV